MRKFYRKSLYFTSAVILLFGLFGLFNLGTSIASAQSGSLSSNIKSAVVSPFHTLTHTYSDLFSQTFSIYKEGGESIWSAFLNLFKSKASPPSSTPPQNVTIITSPEVSQPLSLNKTPSKVVQTQALPPIIYQGLTESRVRELIAELNNQLKQELLSIIDQRTSNGTTTIIYRTSGGTNLSPVYSRISDVEDEIENIDSAPSDFTVGGNLTVDGSSTFNGTTTFGAVAFTGGTVSNLNVTDTASINNLAWINATGTSLTVTNGNFTTLAQGGNAVCDMSGNCNNTLAGNFFKQGGNAFGTAATLGTTDNNLLNFITNNTNRLTIVADGNVGIAFTSPLAKLDLWGNLNVATGTTPALFVNTATGNVGIGTAAPSANLTVKGNILQSMSSGPLLVASTTDAALTGAVAVRVVGNYAYTVGGSHFAIIDISKPSKPVVVGSIDDSTNINTSDVAGLQIAGNYVYLGTKGRLTIVDISNPSAPVVVSSLTSTLFSNTDALSIYISGKFVFVASGRGGLAHRFISVDISNPTTPVIVSSVSFDALGAPMTGNNAFVNGIAVQGKYAYIAIGSGATDLLQIYDISTPTNMSLISQTSLPATSDLATDILADGKYVYVEGILTLYGSLMCRTWLPFNLYLSKRLRTFTLQSW